MKLNTVNVITLVGGVLNSVVSFSDDTEGNKEAEALFLKLVKLDDEELDDETLDDILNDGIYEFGDSEHVISHSMSEEVILEIQ